MTPAESAVDNHISFECKKDALQQRQSGDWKISFTVQGIDMDDRITKAPMGTRFVAVLVAINDDELPIAQTGKEKSTTPHDVLPATPRRLDKPAGAKPDKRDWREVDPTTQAGIRCNEPVFAAFLQEKYPAAWRELQDAADVVRAACGVKSRKLFNTDHRARVLWHQLDEQFQAWKALEHA